LNVHKDSPNDSSYKAKIFAPTLGRPAVEKGLEGDLRFRIQTIVAEQAVIG
jgi:hypothetical protein